MSLVAVDRTNHLSVCDAERNTGASLRGTSDQERLVERQSNPHLPEIDKTGL